MPVTDGPALLAVSSWVLLPLVIIVLLAMIALAGIRVYDI